MPKCSLKNRILQLRVSTCSFYSLCFIAIITFFTYYGKYNYSHVPRDTIENELYKEIASTLPLKKTKPDCKYGSILENKNSHATWDVPKKFDDFSAKGIVNGSYTPEECNPHFSVAIIITYRNRQQQLDVFIPYMHNFLRKQNIHYKIYVIEQQDEKPFNKGLLHNIAARYAIAEKFPCLILHDVDLLPLDESNLYVCMKHPRHMSASIDKFRFVLIYDWLVGGALAIRSDQYKLMNGFSNKFTGWGGEDDDFAERIFSHKLNILRFPREMSRYTMLRHPPASRNKDRLRIMAENKKQPATKDGINSIIYETMQVRYNRLFTQIVVKL